MKSTPYRIASQCTPQLNTGNIEALPTRCSYRCFIIFASQLLYEQFINIALSLSFVRDRSTVPLKCIIISSPETESTLCYSQFTSSTSTITFSCLSFYSQLPLLHNSANLPFALFTYPQFNITTNGNCT